MKKNWDKVFNNEPSKICGRQSLKNFTWSILKYFASIVNCPCTLLSFLLLMSYGYFPFWNYSTA